MKDEETGDEILPKSISQSTVNILGIDLVVHQLNNGEQVVEENSVMEFFKRLTNPNFPSMTAEEAKKLATVMQTAIKSENRVSEVKK